MSLKPDEIRALRDGLELSQQQLADLTGVHWMTVSRWERGQLSPGPFQEALLLKFQTASKRGAVVAKTVAALRSRGLDPLQLVYTLMVFAELQGREEGGESFTPGEGFTLRFELPEGVEGWDPNQAVVRDQRARPRSESQEVRPAPKRGRRPQAGESQA